jgi:hypothetical protein
VKCISVLNIIISIITKNLIIISIINFIVNNTKMSDKTSTDKVTKSTSNYFNGGKMQHVFKYEKNKYNRNSSGNIEFSSMAAVRAFNMSNWWVKIHGSCWMIDSGPGPNMGKVYKRYDSRGKPNPDSNTLLDSDPQPSITEDKKHSYSWEPLQSSDTPGLKGKQKKLITKIWQAVYKFVEKNKNRGKITVEMCGNNFQKTPGIPYTVAIIEHHEQLLESILLNYNLDSLNILENIKNIEYLEKFLSRFAIEGFIVKDPLTGELFKIRSNMLLENCPHELVHKHWIKNKNIGNFEILLPIINSYIE